MYIRATCLADIDVADLITVVPLRPGTLIAIDARCGKRFHGLLCGKEWMQEMSVYLHRVGRSHNYGCHDTSCDQGLDARVGGGHVPFAWEWVYLWRLSLNSGHRCRSMRMYGADISKVI